MSSPPEPTIRPPWALMASEKSLHADDLRPALIGHQNGAVVHLREHVLLSFASA